jgi:hypothetical protein
MKLKDRSVIWSWGGGVQTIALLCLIAKGELPKPELAIMADTGRERASTWRYHHAYAKPLLDKVGIPFEIASHDLAIVDLYAHNGDLLLPVYTENGKLPTFCSNEWKKYVCRRKLRKMDYGPENPIILWFGMSLDEVGRMRKSDVKWIENYYPLCFDVKKRRYECLKVIEDFGLPKPPNSCCWMCSNMADCEWAQMKREDPEDFWKAVLMGRAIREVDRVHGKGDIFLHKSRVPLNEVDLTKTESPLPMFEMCNGVCFT